MLEEILIFLKPIFLQTLPSVIGSLLLIIFGWVLSRILKGLTEKTLEKIKIDQHVKIGKRISFSEIISLGVYWIIFLVFINSAIENLKIESVSKYFDMIIDFILNLLGGIFILIIGYSLSSYIQSKILQSNITHAQIVAQIVFVFSLIITVEMALKIIGLPTQLLDTILIIIVASLGIALAIAFGLGLKDIVASSAKKYFKE